MGIFNDKQGPVYLVLEGLQESDFQSMVMEITTSKPKD